VNLGMLLNGEKAAVIKKYFASLPTAEAHHQWHPTGREVAMLKEYVQKSLKNTSVGTGWCH